MIIFKELDRPIESDMLKKIGAKVLQLFDKLKELDLSEACKFFDKQMACETVSDYNKLFVESIKKIEELNRMELYELNNEASK